MQDPVVDIKIDFLCPNITKHRFLAFERLREKVLLYVSLWIYSWIPFFLTAKDKLSCSEDM